MRAPPWRTVAMHGVSTSGEAHEFTWNPGWTDETGFTAVAGARSSVTELLIMYKAMLHAYKLQTAEKVDSTPGSPFKYMRRIFTPHIGVQGKPKESFRYCLGAYRTELPGNLSAPTINRVLLGSKRETVFGLKSAGTQVFHQNGARPGAFGALNLAPSIDSAVFVLENSLPHYDVCDYIGQIILGPILGEDQLPDYLSLVGSVKRSTVSLYDKISAYLDMGKDGVPPDFPLTSYEGDYYNSSGSPCFTVKLEQGKLILFYLGHPLKKYTLEPYGGNDFYYPPNYTQEICKQGMWPYLPPQTRIVSFGGGGEGVISGFTYHHDFSASEPETFTKSLTQPRPKI